MNYQAIMILEIISTILIGLVLLYPFGKLDLSIIVWALGVMVTISTLAISEKVRSEIRDSIADIQKINELVDLYLKANDEDFNELRNNVINDTKNKLSDLSKKVATVDGSVYYFWLQDQFARCKKNIKAVSTVDETIWYDDPQENNFLMENIKASNRGVSVKRFFITTKERFRSSSNRRIIKDHIENNLHPSIIWWEDIENNKNLLVIIRDGFVIIDDRIVLSDVSLKGEIIGMISKIKAESDGFLSTFNQLDRYVRNYHTQNEQVRYIEILKLLVKELETRHGSIDVLKRSEKQNDEKLKNDLKDWSELIEEIEKYTHTK